MAEAYPPRYFPYFVAVEQLTGEQDATGEELKNWETFTSAWISIEQLGGSERVVASQIFADINVRCWMKFQDGIKPKMRLNYNSGARIFDILAVVDRNGKRRHLQLLCVERVESGS